MKHLIDIHVVLSTPEDMEQWEDDAEEASERLNELLHLVYDLSDEDIAIDKLEKMLQHVWENWMHDKYLLDIDENDLRDWVDHLVATWDDEAL